MIPFSSRNRPAGMPSNLTIFKRVLLRQGIRLLGGWGLYLVFAAFWYAKEHPALVVLLLSPAWFYLNQAIHSISTTDSLLPPEEEDEVGAKAGKSPGDTITPDEARAIIGDYVTFAPVNVFTRAAVRRLALVAT